MAKFEWGPFLTRHHIPFNVRGPNTPFGTATIHCPFCGNADPSDHMVLWPNGGWRCWRNHEHGGKHPARLVQVLIGCSYVEAQRLTSGISMPGAEEFAAIATMFKPKPATVAQPRKLELLPEFKPFSGGWGCWPFVAYMHHRGFYDDPKYLHSTYGLHYATRGLFKGRVIFPVVHEGKLISWTGRTIYQAEPLRYMSLTPNHAAASNAGIEPALAPINHYLPWWDYLLSALDGSDTGVELVLVEGPLDALKVNLLGIGNPRIAATCWMGSEPTKPQIDLLHRLAPKFARRWIISDSDMQYKAYRIADALRPLQFTVAALPRGVNDPAELRTRAQLLATLR